MHLVIRIRIGVDTLGLDHGGRLAVAVAAAPAPSSGVPCACDTPDAVAGSTALAIAALRAALAAR
jgi:hypothetical protein